MGVHKPLCTQTLSHSRSHIEIFRCIISVAKTHYSVLADFKKKKVFALPYVHKWPCITFRIIYILKYISVMKVKMKVLSHVYKLESGSENISLPVFFFCVSLLALCRLGESRPLVMLLLGAINGNVSRLSKWWDLTYGIKASLDPHLLQMEAALSQGVQHQGEAYWGIEKDKMTGNTFSLCLNYNLFQCILKISQRPFYYVRNVIVFPYFSDPWKAKPLSGI